MLIETVSIASLSLDPVNARKHPVNNIEAIKGSLQKFGQQKPIVVDKKNIVIAGNGTLVAAKALGWKDITIVRTDLEGYDAAAFALADNRTAELAVWDMEILASTVGELQLENFSLGEIGFDTKFLDELLNKEDDEPEPKVTDRQEFLIVIECANETDQEELYREFSERNIQCKIMS